MKKAIVVGATSGIGKSLARKLAQDNYKVGITGRRIRLLEKLKAENSMSYIPIAFDVQDSEISFHKLEELTKEVGGLDLIIICSGLGGLNEGLDFEREKKIILTNVMGFTAVADWSYKYFEKQKYGHLVTITSIAGLRGNRMSPGYFASKAYQINYLEGLRQKATKDGMPICITDVRPGFVDTDMLEGDNLIWVMSLEKAARQIYSAIKKKRTTVYVTKRWGFVARLLKWIPRIIYKRM